MRCLVTFLFLIPFYLYSQKFQTTLNLHIPYLGFHQTSIKQDYIFPQQSLAIYEVKNTTQSSWLDHNYGFTINMSLHHHHLGAYFETGYLYEQYNFQVVFPTTENSSREYTGAITNLYWNNSSGLKYRYNIYKRTKYFVLGGIVINIITNNFDNQCCSNSTFDNNVFDNVLHSNKAQYGYVFAAGVETRWVQLSLNYSNRIIKTNTGSVPLTYVFINTGFKLWQ